MREEKVESKLYIIIFSFLSYLLYLEALYLSKSSMCQVYSLSSFDNKDSSQLINHESHILMLSENKSLLNLWLHSLTNILSQYCSLPKNNLGHPLHISLKSFHFCDYFFLKQDRKYISVIPSQDSQILLLYQINIIFAKFKGDSLFNLINSLNVVLYKWIVYFKFTNQLKIFVLLDYLIYLKLRSWRSKKKIVSTNARISYSDNIVLLINLRSHFLLKEKFGRKA